VPKSGQQSRSFSLQGNVLGTRKGVWVLGVAGVVIANGDFELILWLRARHLEERRLVLLVRDTALASVQSRELVAEGIRNWIEQTEGDGQLDLRSMALNEQIELQP
jgi:hypothetical protein